MLHIHWEMCTIRLYPVLVFYEQQMRQWRLDMALLSAQQRAGLMSGRILHTSKDYKGHRSFSCIACIFEWRAIVHAWIALHLFTEWDLFVSVRPFVLVGIKSDLQSSREACGGRQNTRDYLQRQPVWIFLILSLQMISRRCGQPLEYYSITFEPAIFALFFCLQSVERRVLNDSSSCIRRLHFLL